MTLPGATRDTRRWPGYLFGGRIRTSTVVLIIAFIAVWWLYDTYEPAPEPEQVPASDVVPPGFIPDPSYTWVPRTQVQQRAPLTTVPPTTTATTTPTTTPTTSTTLPPEPGDGPVPPISGEPAMPGLPPPASGLPSPAPGSPAPPQPPATSVVPAPPTATTPALAPTQLPTPAPATP
jgi:hypothetical protein